MGKGGSREQKGDSKDGIQEKEDKVDLKWGEGNGADVVYWTCTNFGEGCLEADFYTDNLQQWPQYFSREELLTERDISVPMGMMGIISSLPEESIPFLESIVFFF